MLKLGNQLVSAKAVSRSREKSPFVNEVLGLGLEKGGFAYVSHQEWLSKAGDVTASSEKNGPRYTLKRYGIDCKAIKLDGKDLAQVAEAEGRKLGNDDIIYVMKASEQATA